MYINRHLFDSPGYNDHDRASILVHEFLHAIGIGPAWRQKNPRCLHATIENGQCFLDPAGLQSFSSCENNSGMGLLNAYRQAVRDNGLTRIRIQEASGGRAGGHFEFRSHTYNGVTYPGLCGEIMVPTFDRAASRAGLAGISDMSIEALKEYGYEIVPGAQAEVSNTPNRSTGTLCSQTGSNGFEMPDLQILQMREDDQKIICDHDTFDAELEEIRERLRLSNKDLD